MAHPSKRRAVSVGAAILMVLMMLSSFVGLTARAEEITFYPSWEEYKAAGEPASTWNDVANAIDAVLEASYAYYHQGDQENAYTAVLNTYNFYYETSGFERNVNGYSGSEVSKAELQFKTARKAVKKDLGEDTIKKEFNSLSEILHIQANHLDGLGDTGESQLSLTGEAPAAEEAAETEAEEAQADAAADDAVIAADTEAATEAPAATKQHLGDVPGMLRHYPA